MDLTRSGTAVGTPRYMSPEHIEGKAVDGRSDIYSFGITCYEMLAGKAPFNGNSAFEIALKHVREEPEPLENLRPDLPPALVALVRKMMAKNRHERPSPRQLLQDIGRLREALTGDDTSLTAMTTVTETAPDKVRLWKRPAWRWGGLAAGALAVLVMVLCIVWPRGESAAQPLPAGAARKLPDEPPPIQKEQEEALKKSVERYLGKVSPNPAGVEDCIDLAVLYLDRERFREAELLFKRMSLEHKSPSAYYFMGLLGRGITDAINKDDAGSTAKYSELFRSKAKDNRVQIVNNYLKKKPRFEEWVNEADLHNIRGTSASSEVSSTGSRFSKDRRSLFKFPIKKSGSGR
jgi:serine/threonine-protein kinase